MTTSARSKPLLETVCIGMFVLTPWALSSRNAEGGFNTTSYTFGNENAAIAGFAIEDFEDATLSSGLTITWRGNFGGGVVGSVSVSGALPNTFDPTNTATDCLDAGCPFPNNVWDGSRASTNGAFSATPQASESNRFDLRFASITEFAFDTGVYAVGIGLSNFQSLNSPDFPRTNHTYFINGQNMGLVESLPSWSPGINVRNSYLLVTATDGDVINEIAFQNDTNLDGLVFDKLSYSVGTLPPETVIDIDPRATYLRAADEMSPGPAGAKKVSLATDIPGHPVVAGDWLLLQRVGDFKFVEGTPVGFEGPHGDWTLRNLWGVFSGSDVLLDDDALIGDKTAPVFPVNRVQDVKPDGNAVPEGNAVPIVTDDDPFPNPSPPPATLFQPSDIPQDFVIDIEGDLESPDPVLVRVPAGATHLFLGAGDVQWFDNSLTTDPGQFGVRIAKVEAGRLLGDYNLNGTVDAADYVVWRKQLGASGLTLAADGDADGEVTEADYGVWRSHFGETVPTMSGIGATVPEPGSIVLMLSVATSLVLMSRAVRIRAWRSGS